MEFVSWITGCLLITRREHSDSDARDVDVGPQVSLIPLGCYKPPVPLLRPKDLYSNLGLAIHKPRTQKSCWWQKLDEIIEAKGLQREYVSYISIVIDNDIIREGLIKQQILRYLCVRIMEWSLMLFPKSLWLSIVQMHSWMVSWAPFCLSGSCDQLWTVSSGQNGASHFWT